MIDSYDFTCLVTPELISSGIFVSWRSQDRTFADLCGVRTCTWTYKRVPDLIFEPVLPRTHNFFYISTGHTPWVTLTLILGSYCWLLQDPPTDWYTKKSLNMWKSAFLNVHTQGVTLQCPTNVHRVWHNMLIKRVVGFETQKSIADELDIYLRIHDFRNVTFNISTIPTTPSVTISTQQLH